MKRKPSLVHIGVPLDAVKLCERRVAHMLEPASLHQVDFNLRRLLAMAYLQGAVDGRSIGEKKAEAAERTMKKVAEQLRLSNKYLMADTDKPPGAFEMGMDKLVEARRALARFKW